MGDFYQLLSLVISLVGFTIVAGKLLMDGECLLVAVGKGVLVFVVLWVAQVVLGSVCRFAAESEPSSEDDVQDRNVGKD